MADLTFRNITDADKEKASKLISLCFPVVDEKRAVNKLRKNKDPILKYSFLAEAGGEVLGQVQFHNIKLPSGREVPMLGLLCVNPNHRGKGISYSLVEYGLHSLAGLEDGVIVIGKKEIFEEYGFDAECMKKLKLDGEVKPLTLMGLEFEDGIFSNEKGFITS